MAHEIHARLNADGEHHYRIWSTNVDDYLTEEMSEEELDAYLLSEAIMAVIQTHRSELPARLKRAHDTGSSSRLGSDRLVTDDWV